MKIYYFCFLVFSVNVIVCSPHWNQNESSFNITTENDNKSTKGLRSLRDDELKDKEGNTTDANNIKNQAQEYTTQIVDRYKEIGVHGSNVNKGRYTHPRLIPIYYGEQAVPHRWIPASPRYGIPIEPRASEPVITHTYGTPFETDTRIPEVVAKPHINEQIIKNPSNNPIETVYVLPQIAYTSESTEEIIPTPYFAPIPIDPNGYNVQKTGKPWIYPPPFLQPRYFRINGQQPYYRHPVHPSPTYKSMKIFPPSVDYGTSLYQEPLPPTTIKERSTGDLHEQRTGLEDNNDGSKHKIIVPENVTSMKNISNTNENNDNYPIYYKNSQTNHNFESPDIDLTKISGFVDPDASNDFSNFNQGYPMYFPPNNLERHPQATYSPYQYPRPKERFENTLRNSYDNNKYVNHELDTNGRNHQDIDNPDKSLNVKNDYGILFAQNIKESLSYTKDFADESKNSQIIDRDTTKQHEKLDSLKRSFSEETIESNKLLLNSKIDSKESTADTQIILTDNLKQLSTVSQKINSEGKSQESLKVTDKKEDEKLFTVIGTPELFDAMEAIESAIKSQPLYSNVFIHKDSETPSTETIAIINDNDNDDQNTGMPQIEVSLDDSDKFVLGNGNRSKAGTENINVQIIREENSFSQSNKTNSNQTKETTIDNEKEYRTENDARPTDHIKDIYDDEGQELIDAIPEDVNQKKSAENNDDEEDEKSNRKNDKQNNTKHENTFFESKSNNNNNQNSGKNPDDRKPQKKDKRYEEQNFDIISYVIPNSETVENKTESNSSDLEYPESERSTNNNSSQESDEKSDKKQLQIGGATDIDQETILNKSTPEDIIYISEKGLEKNKDYNKYDDYDTNNEEIKGNTMENKENNVKLSPNNFENLGDPKIERTEPKTSIDQNTNKNTVGHANKKVDTWYNDKVDGTIDVNFNPKITENTEITKCKEQSENDSGSEISSKDNNIRLVIEVTPAIEKTTSLGQDTPVSDSNQDNGDGLNNTDDNNDDFDEISSASQTTTEEAIKSKLGFKTTCIKHPVYLSMNGNTKNAAEPMRLEFYRKIFEEYYKNHNVVPQMVIQKDIRSFVHKNGTVVNEITATVWNIKDDEKPVELRTKTIQQRRKKNCKLINEE